ncbi:MAG TPA: serine/threonine-protein kinase [Chthoniobacterales bacterium]|nr:serine/threonine-protein kinase [Chthoniobacterales bacterium]
MPDSTASSRFQQFAGYEVEGELGRGGMGVVYLARQLKLNRRVALKTLTGHYGKEELQRFLAEAETAAGLHHTNIAQIYEVGEHDGVPFYSMEYVEGGSVADRLRKELPNPRDAAQLMILVARALHVAHQNGIVHRDMKPANVLLDPDGVPKVADFGIAKRLKQDSQLTVSGAVIGTPTYMAPEQAKGTSRHVGPAADVYSLGAILYEMLSGRPPFLPEESETAIMVRVLTEDPVSPAFYRPDIPRDLEVICLKCLQKDPRDRYPSAAAFAEDLRRYLDDEPIVARPPTRLVRTVKWVRRNPWKAVGRAALLVILTLGVDRLVRWELYERNRFEYATEIDTINGQLLPNSKISETAAARHQVTYKFSRRGRFGPVTRVDAVNARGHPAAVLSFFGYDVLPNYVDGITGAQKTDDRRRETTAIQIIFHDKEVVEHIGLDANGRHIWKMVFERIGGSNTRSIRARYLGGRGFDLGSRQGEASLTELERDENGRDVRARFSTSSGLPAVNAEKVYGYDIARDNNGRIVRVMNIGNDGKPAANRTDVVGLQLSWDEKGRCTRGAYLDVNGMPTTINGVAALEYRYDNFGNLIQMRSVNDKNELVNTQGGGAQTDYKRDEYGQIIEEIAAGLDPSGRLVPQRRRLFSYDEFGYPAEVQLIGRVSLRSKYKCDAVGNVVEEQNLDSAGKPAAGPRGWAIRRVQYSNLTNPPGWREEETYFDVHGQKTFCDIGHHRQVTDFDQNGNIRRVAFEQNDPAKYHYFRYVSEVDYDGRGILRKSLIRYENEKGELALESGRAFTGVETFYELEQGTEREILEWKFGCDVAALGAPVYRTETERHKTGARKRIVRQACDENRQPLKIVSNGTAARFEQQFDEIDQLERINETGFDESVVGFSSREAKFSSGSLASVTHHRQDGSQLDSVGVFVKAIIPEQPKAKELQVGDQLVMANDQPITSAYGWVFGNFRGGWIEVVRSGKRIRIEGFQEGALGVTLEDRATDLRPTPNRPNN